MRDGIIVLGMHRSGTSLIAEMIHQWGAYSSEKDRVRSNWWNPRGHWEHKPLVEFNRKLLKAVGGTWDLPPLESAEPQIRDLAGEGAYRRECGDLLSSMRAEGRPWFWKDPRLCLLLPFWREFLQDPTYVVCVRDPLDVALSLRERNGIPLGAGMCLWHRYMLGMSTGMPPNAARIVVSYARVLSDSQAECVRLSEFLDRNFPDVNGIGDDRPSRMRQAVDGELSRARKYQRPNDLDTPAEDQVAVFDWFTRQAVEPGGRSWPDTPGFRLPAGWREQIAEHWDMFKGNHN